MSKHNVTNESVVQTNFANSIHVLKKYGLPLSFIRHLTTGFPTISSQYQDLYSEYYLLRWSAEYALEQIVEGHITHNGTSYKVIFRTPRGKMLEDANNLFAYVQYFLSFRKPQTDISVEPTVIIWKAEPK